MFKEIFKHIDYPILLDTFDELKFEGIPPWELINEKYPFWKDQFNNSNLVEYFPFARTINDDVIATFKNKCEEIFLFNLPLSTISIPKPFKNYSNINLWLKLVLDDSYEYIIGY